MDALPPAEKKALWNRIKSENPEMAAFMQDMKRTFGEISVTFVQLGEFTVGSQPEAAFPAVFDYDHEKAMLAWEKSIEDAAVKKRAMAKEAKRSTKRRK